MTSPERITIDIPDSRSREAVLHRPPPDRATGRAVVIIHDATGFRRDTERHCERFAAEGYVALAPDLYAGLNPGCIVRVIQSMRTHDGEAYAVIDAARRALASDADVDEARIGVIGFCMGGGFALCSAADQPFAVAAPFYGHVPKDRHRLKGLCPVLAQYGAKDMMFAPHAQRLAGHLAALDVDHEVVMHDGVGHSFMNAHTDLYSTVGRYFPPLYGGYHEPTEADAWQRVLAFFNKHLGSSSLGSGRSEGS
ncbi:MAG: dienelactone hydrolase family protein [Myxococcota bacterium]